MRETYYSRHREDRKEYQRYYADSNRLKRSDSQREYYSRRKANGGRRLRPREVWQAGADS